MAHRKSASRETAMDFDSFTTSCEDRGPTRNRISMGSMLFKSSSALETGTSPRALSVESSAISTGTARPMESDTERTSTGCLRTILTEYPDSFASALVDIGCESSITFHVCYGTPDYHVDGPCTYCTRVGMRYNIGKLHILMRR